MPRLIATLAAVVAWLALAATPALALDARLVSIGSFSSPIHVAAPPGDLERVFVVERAGTIQVLRGGTRRTFLDISRKTSTESERGLQSIAFAPDYATSGRFYVYYTMVNDPATAANETGDIRVEEYRRSGSDPEVADPAGARPVLTLDHSTFGNHNGGGLQFGPDGLLYVGTGDGGLAGDPFRNGQDRSTLLGKLLRIDPDGGSPYAVPAGNPFGTEVFHYGLRNPYRFSFDRLTGDLVLADVGQGRREEINLRRAGAPGGANFGWSCREGSLVYSDATPDPACPASGAPPGYVAPVLDYPHEGGACSIIGGHVVRDPALPSLSARYLYGDLCTGVLRSVDLANPAGDRRVEIDVALPPRLVSFGEDARGCVYVVSIGGPVYRMESPAGAAPCPASPSVFEPVSLDSYGKRRQRALRQKAIRIGLECSTACRARAHTSIKVEGSGRRIKLKGVTRSVASRLVLVIPLPSSVRATLRRVFDDGRTALATVTLSAKDPFGRVDRGSRRVRLVG